LPLTLPSCDLPGAALTPGDTNFTPPASGTFVFEFAGYTGTEAGGTITGNVLRVGGSTGTASVDVLAQDPSLTFFGTESYRASSLAGDYVAGTQTLTFGPGVTSQPFTVTVNNDGTTPAEANEAFDLLLSNPQIVTGTSVTPILGDDVLANGII